MINLMPPEIKESLHFARLNVTLVQYCILIGVISFAVTGTMLFGLSLVSKDEQQVIEQIEARKTAQDELRDVEKEAKELSERIDTIAALLDREVDFSEIITQIGALMPDGAELITLNLPNNAKRAKLPLTIGVEKQSTAVVIQQNFENSELFAGADIESINAAETRDDGSIASYEVVMVVSYVSEEKDEPKESTTETGEPAAATGEGNL